MSRTPATKPINELTEMTLRALKQAYEARGITGVNVGKDSDSYVRFGAMAEVLGLAIANSDSIAADVFANTATDEAVLEHATALGLNRRDAEEASGKVILSSTASAYIDTTQQLTSPDGVLFQVSEADTYANNEYIPVVAVNAGDEGNTDAGVKLEWLSSITNVNTFATVDNVGLIGGYDQETIEELRQRIADRRALASVAGNPEHLIAIAEGTSSSIQKAFAYPALFGPGSGLIVLMGYYNAGSNYSRVITDRVISEVATNISNILPGEVRITVQSVRELDNNIVLSFDLPEPKSAGGSGSGWLDAEAIRFPAPYSEDYAYVRTVYNDSHFLINCSVQVNPTVGNHVAFWDTTLRKFQHAVIISVESTDGSDHEIIVDKAIPNVIAEDTFVVPDCVNLDSYATEILAAFQRMGPGEATEDSDRLPRASRRPEVGTGYTPKISTRLWKDLLTNYYEVGDVTLEDAAYTTPTIPTIGSAPYVLVPDGLGIYPPGTSGVS